MLTSTPTVAGPAPAVASTALPPRVRPPTLPPLTPGVRLRVTQFVRHGHRDAFIVREVLGTLVEQSAQPSGSWFAHPRGKKVELSRLLIRKDDGELSLLTVDDRTRVTVIG